MKNHREDKDTDFLTAIFIMISYVLVYYTAVKIHYLDNYVCAKIEKIEHILENKKWAP